MSRETSLLVLESQAMFDAFGVDRHTPTAKWTGEDSLDEVASNGTVSHADVDAKPAGTAKAATEAPKAKSSMPGKDKKGDFETPATATPPPTAASANYVGDC